MINFTHKKCILVSLLIEKGEKYYQNLLTMYLLRGNNLKLHES